MTSERHSSSAVDLTNTNSCQLNSTHVTPTNCSRITSPGPAKACLLPHKEKKCHGLSKHLSVTCCWSMAQVNNDGFNHILSTPVPSDSAFFTVTTSEILVTSVRHASGHQSCRAKTATKLFMCSRLGDASCYQQHRRFD